MLGQLHGAGGDEIYLRDTVTTATRQIAGGFDKRHGGIASGSNKFPPSMAMELLLRENRKQPNPAYVASVELTLDRIERGGIYDHLGGGIHRYSTDPQWLVPHFEKMLYDQAQLACCYLDAYQITHEEPFAKTARDILEYVQRDLTGSQGQFYSAEDADSPLPEKPTILSEGAFYVWDQNQIEGALGKGPAVVFDYYYGVEPKGNVRSDSRGELSGKNVLTVTHTLEDTSRHFKMSIDETRGALESSRQRLFQTRAHRPRPRLDDKAITAWNGLMISAFARASQVLDDPRFLASAQKARAFLKANCYQAGTGKLLRRFRAGDAAIEGYVDDYAFLIQGLLDLYETSFEIDDLNWAMALQNTQATLFEDTNHGAFFTTAESDPSLLLRMKEDYDGAEPTANSVTVLNLLRLAQMTDNKTWRKSADAALGAFADRLHREPGAMPQMQVALGFSLAKPKQIVIAGKRDAADTKAMLRVVHRAYLPNKILLLADGAEGQRVLGSHLEFLRDVQPLDGKATGFVCENYTCQLPTTNLEVLHKQLSDPKPR
jgi:hypothetical protein